METNIFQIEERAVVKGRPGEDIGFSLLTVRFRLILPPGGLAAVGETSR
jgi:hypothetical protein